ncbi:MAG: adenylate/guanylate cyclase domain-containing protein [Spirochaetota bacterium]|nr:MAG: adenylate/guanylate cyclase domain-containing protein [Spirochaetota bacterium]
MVVGLIDIDGFARACGGKSDIEIFNMLNDFYNLVEKVVGKAKGTVIKFMGDSALVVFPEGRAKLAAASLHEVSSSARGIWKQFDETCAVRIKANVGPVLMGSMGHEKRIDVIGNTVNQLFLMSRNGPDLSDDLKQLVEQ